VSRIGPLPEKEKEGRTMDRIYAEVKEIILDIIEMDADEIEDNEEFAQFDHIDSLQALDILTALERNFKIKLAEEELRNFTTINNIVDVVKRNVSALVE